MAHFSTYYASRENFIPLSPPTGRAGRTLYRTRGRCRYKTLPTHAPGRRYRYKTLPARAKTPIVAHFQHGGRTLYRTRGRCRYKTLPARSPRGSNRYKTLPAPPKWPISARITPAGRTLYRFHHPHDEQGEKSPAPTLHLTHQRAPPPISHAIRLLELSIIPRNVTIPTI